jgi:hypothetical protein
VSAVAIGRGDRSVPLWWSKAEQPAPCWSRRYKGIVWIIGIGIIIAFIAACETALVFARRNPQFVAKLYMLDALVKFDEETSNTDAEPDVPKPRDENELL